MRQIFIIAFIFSLIIPKDDLTIKGEAKVTKIQYLNDVVIGKKIYENLSGFEINQELNYIKEGSKKYAIINVIKTDTLKYEYEILIKKRYVTPTTYETDSYYYNKTTKTLLRIANLGYGYTTHFIYQITKEYKKEMIIIK